MDTDYTSDNMKRQDSSYYESLSDSRDPQGNLMSRLEYLAAVVNIFQMNDASAPEIIHFALDQAVKLTKSDAACLYMLDADSEISEYYCIDAAGGSSPDCFQFIDHQLLRNLFEKRKSIIINNTTMVPSCENNKAFTEAACLFTPIIERDRVEAIAGLYGKTSGYGTSGVRSFNLLMDSMLKLVNNIRTADALKTAMEESRQRQAERTALFEASRHLLGHDDFNCALIKILDICRRVACAEYGFVVLVDNEKSESDSLIALGVGPDEVDIQTHYDLIIEMHNLEEHVLGRIPDTLQFSGDRVGSLLKQTIFKSFLGSPITVDNSYVGSLWLFNKSGGFEQSDTDLLENFCGLINIALQNHKNKSSLARSRENARRLYAESKRMQEVYESLLQATPDGVIVYEMIKGVTYINPAFSNIFGYSLDEVKDLTLKSIMDFESPHNGNEWLSIQYHETRSNLETKGRTRDGEVLDINLSVSGFTNLSADVAGIVFIVRDLTQPKMLRKQLYHSQKQEALGVLAGGIAHDFNNVLSAIIGYTELTMNNLSNDDRSFHHLQQVMKASRRAGDLVQQILAFSRQTDSEFRPTNVTPILKETIKLLRASLPSTIEIVDEINCPDDVVLASPTQIHQVMMNLCTNARQAMKNGGLLTLTLYSTNLPEESGGMDPLFLSPGRYLKIIVRDSGPGIQADILERIFEPYFTTKIQGEGSGLGLAMVHSIVEMHHGKVTVQSTPGLGAEFTVYLPLTQDNPSVVKLDPEYLPKGDESILVVDDEVELTRLCKQYLKRLGYRVTTADSPVKAMEMFEQNPDRFDILFTDLTMPKMTGVDLLRACRAIKPNLPVVICSGYSEDLNNLGASELHGAQYLHKPFELQGLANSVRKALDQKKEEE